MNDDDQRRLESALLAWPQAGQVMAGTGGLRKIRYAPLASSGGKSGGIRVCYAWFPAFDQLFFVMAFAKNEQANLTAAEKKQVRKLLQAIGDDLEKRRR